MDSMASDRALQLTARAEHGPEQQYHDEAYAPLNPGSARSVEAPAPPASRRGWGRGPLLALCLAGAAAIALALVGAWPRPPRQVGLGGSSHAQQGGPLGLRADMGGQDRHPVMSAGEGAGRLVDPTGHEVEELLSGAADIVVEHWQSRRGESPEWIVVGRGGVEVRAEKVAGSRLLGRKSEGERVVGRREGAWLALRGERGYLQMTSNGHSNVAERNTAFERIPNGTCADWGYAPITDPITCKAAGFALVLNAKKVTVELVPIQGCIVRGARGSICCAGACPAPTTTTATESSSTTTTATITATRTISTSTTTTRTTTMRTTIKPTGTPSLYCWALIRVRSYEVWLMRKLYPKSASIFGCNQWVVFGDAKAWIGGHDWTTYSYAPKAAYVGLWLNVPTFMNAWRKIFDAGDYNNHDWTAKVDADAVFMPNRLRQHMAPLTGARMYIKNCAQFGSMQGPVEVLSKSAVQALAAGRWGCVSSIDQSHIGEDGFIQKCMEMLGVEAHMDDGLLHDKYCGVEPKPCNNYWAAAFHPFKNDKEYNQCLNETGFGASILDPLGVLPEKMIME